MSCLGIALIVDPVPTQKTSVVAGSLFQDAKARGREHSSSFMKRLSFFVIKSEDINRMMKNIALQMRPCTYDASLCTATCSRQFQFIEVIHGTFQAAGKVSPGVTL